ncbi:hypothetical protein N644_0942 [Lactiplantibacillus paraplantarum]|nr:hypothetical protein N644_0942 [Lactiplantibacillus paraplantarum]
MINYQIWVRAVTGVSDDDKLEQIFGRLTYLENEINNKGWGG